MVKGDSGKQLRGSRMKRGKAPEAPEQPGHFSKLLSSTDIIFTSLPHHIFHHHSGYLQTTGHSYVIHYHV